MTRKANSVSSSSVHWRPRRGGPYPHLRLGLHVKVTQGQAMYLAVVGEGKSFRTAADELGLSLTTAWRRYWWFSDWMLPVWHGRPPGPIPPQRGTRACPRGRPYLPTLHGPGGPLHIPQKGTLK